MESSQHKSPKGLMRVPNEILVNICSIILNDGNWNCDYCQSEPESVETAQLHSRYHSDFRILEHFWDIRYHPAHPQYRRHDLSMFRLVCRRFAAVALRFIHTRISFELKNADIARLQEIGHHPQFRHSVRSLKYRAATYYAAATRRTDVPQEDGLSVDDRWKHGKFTEQDGRDLASLYSAHCQLNGIRQDAPTHVRDLLCFRDVFPRLSHLRSVETMTSQTPQIISNGYPVSFYSDGIREFVVTMAALHRSATKLDSLKINALDWRFFQFHPQVLEHISSNLDQLQHFQLALSADIRRLSDTPLIRRGFNVRRIHIQTLTTLRALLKTRVLERFIEPFENLRSLLIELPIQTYTRPSDVIGRLSDIIPRGRKWVNLTKLSLRGMECEANDLLELLLGHKDTLRHLCLGTIVLRSGAWDFLFQEIRDNLRLETACICREIWWFRPGGRRERPYFDPVGGCGREEVTGLETLSRVNEFLCMRVLRNEDGRSAEDKQDNGSQASSEVAAGEQ